MVNQVPVVAILMIIQGVLESLTGLVLAAMGPLMFSVLSNVQPQPGVQPPPKEMAGVLSGVYLVMGIGILALGVLRIVAGVRNLKYRGRILGIVAMSAGLLTSFTCWCLPTSLGILIYGLIVYLNSDVVRAFEMGDRGLSADQIRQSINLPPDAQTGSPYQPPTRPV